MTQQSTALFPDGVAFVAGGSGGIGSAICLGLAEAGADVVLTYRSNKAKADAVVEAIEAMGRKATAIALSLEDEAAVKDALDNAANQGGIHTVVYATGPFVELKFLSKAEPQELKDYLLGDTMACYNLTYAALPHLRASKGSIVAVTTTCTSRWANQDGLSAIPKSAVNSIMQGIACEEGRQGVRANMVALGVIEAGMFDQLVETGLIDDKYMSAMANNVPLKRLGQAEDVANAAVFLASSKASYTTGQMLYVDGGYSL